MMKNKIVDEKSLGVDTADNRPDNLNERSNHLPKQAISSSTKPSTSETSTPTKTTISLSSTSAHIGYARSRSKSSVSYAETSKANKLPICNDVPNRTVKHFNPTSSTNLSSSLINAFQMPQNIAQVFPNINMSSLPDYLTQLPSVSMPSMPAMPNISITMPSMPSLSMPSMPNLSMPNISMPSIPSIPNINIPSISEIMNFPVRRNIKSWNQICSSVRESRKRFNDICPSLPFMFNFCYDNKREKLRIYFLSSQRSPETTLFYCDVPLVKQANAADRSNGTIFEIDEDMSFEQGSDLRPVTSDSVDDVAHPVENGGDTADFEENTGSDNEYGNDYDYEMENNLSSKSSSLPSLSSLPSSDSFPQDPTFRKEVASATSLIANYDTMVWKPLIMMNRAYFASSEENSEFVQSKQAKSDGRTQSKTASSSREEDLILQRKRILYNGVVSYDFHAESARFIFTIKNIIYWFDDVEITNVPTPAPPSPQPTSTTDENNIKSDAETERPESCHSDLNVPKVNLCASSEKLPSPPPYIPHKLMTNTHVKMNATMCPYNPDIVAYLADNDLWVCDLVSCKEMRLTSTEYSKTGVMAGRPSFVMQEEFSRFNGFWWRPMSYNEDFSQMYAILCEFVDESAVDVCAISSWDGTSEFHRFPKAGCSNAKSTLKLVHFQLNDLKTLSKANNNNRHKVTIQNLPSFKALFPEYEYLIRCGWHSWDIVWAQLLNRQQNKLVIIFVSMTDLFPAQIIYEESCKNHWYNCHDILYFFPYAQCYENPEELIGLFSDLFAGSFVQFLWASEATGYRHLYKITVQLVDYPLKYDSKEEDSKLISDAAGDAQPESTPLINDTSHPPTRPPCNNQPSPILKSKIIDTHQITSGNWEVFESMFWVDEKRDLIYFLGNKDSPLESHLYVVSSWSTPRVQPRRLTKEDFTHSRIFFDPEFQYCLDFQSNLTVPPFGFFNKIVSPDHDSKSVSLEPISFFLGLSEDVVYDESIEYYEKVQSLGPTPQLFEYKLKSGELIYGFLFKPDFMEPGAKYPVLLEIYGGPEVQLVNKSFKDVRQHRRHLIASEGYIVVGFDSRGSKYRGVDFERHIYKRLGQVEIDDQVEALEWLAENTGFIDMARVAIHGWSYGGYLSLMALAQRPDIFKCSIAGAPVTNWLLYDTGYTERYMGLPEENEEGYRASSVLTYSKNFPDEYNRLLIIHGLMDENVHFAHTAQLINCLIMLGKPYNLNVFPFERHSLRKLHSSEHYEATLLQYLQQNL